MIHTPVQSKAAATTLTMPTLRKRSRREIVENPPQSEIEIPMKDHKNKKSEYELSREERIRENRERMGKLGLFDISLSLKPNPPSRPTASKKPKSPVSLKPSRRSTRFFHFHPQNSIFDYIYHNPNYSFFFFFGFQIAECCSDSLH